MEAIKDCPVCLNTYDSNERVPLVLICGHTLCKACTSDLYQVSKVITCPLDRKIDNRSIQEIPHSSLILNLISQLSSMSTTVKYLKLSNSERLQAMKDQAQENISSLEDHLLEVRQVKDRTSQLESTVLSEIQSHFELLNECLEDREEELLSEVENYTEEYLVKLREAENETIKLIEETDRQYSEASEDTQNPCEIDPAVLPELPSENFCVKFFYINAVENFKKIGRITAWNVKAVQECRQYKNITYWMIPPCCGLYYCCSKCHDSKEDHKWVYANRMVCMFCETEQNYRKLPNYCEKCSYSHRGIISK